MDKIAIISDIHGNLPALKAVAEDIMARGISRIFCLGDMAGFGPNGEEVITWCREHCELIIYGNWEEFFHIYTHYDKSKKYIEHLSAESLEYIKDLPLSHKMWISGKRLHLIHGRPVHKETMWMEHPAEKLMELFTSVEDHMPPDIVGYGDLHRQYKYDFHGSHRVLFNPGSVGAPFGGTEACYMVISGNIGSKVLSPISMEFIKLPYNIEQAIQNAMNESSWFDYEPYIKSITTGTWQNVN